MLTDLSGPLPVQAGPNVPDWKHDEEFAFLAMDEDVKGRSAGNETATASACFLHLENGPFLVDTKDIPQGVGNLPKGALCAHGFHNVWHDIVGAFSGRLQSR